MRSLESWALVPREESRRLVVVPSERSSIMFEVTPRRSFLGSELWSPIGGEMVRTDGHAFEGHGLTFVLFYADEDTGRAAAALCDLNCAVLFMLALRWFEVRP